MYFDDYPRSQLELEESIIENWMNTEIQKYKITNSSSYPHSPKLLPWRLLHPQMLGLITPYRTTPQFLHEWLATEWRRWTLSAKKQLMWNSSKWCCLISLRALYTLRDAFVSSHLSFLLGLPIFGATALLRYIEVWCYVLAVLRGLRRRTSLFHPFFIYLVRIYFRRLL